MRHLTACSVAALLLLASTAALAGGFNIYEMGARATALGGAFTATADDGSAIFYNPAGLAWLGEGFSLTANVSPIRPVNKFTRAEGLTEGLYPGDATAETQSQTFLPSGLYLSYGLDEEWSFGLGAYTPFGLGVKWADPETFAGRSLSTNAQIQGFYVTPVATWHPTEDLALSAGVNAVVTNLDLDRIMTLRLGADPQTRNVAEINLSGMSDPAFSPSFGMMIRPNERFSLGINYKGGVTNKFRDQTAEFTQILTGDPAVDALVTQNLAAIGGEGEQNVSGDLDFPSIFSIGLRMMPTARLALMVDFVYFGWSVFDEVVLDFESAPTSTLEEDYEDGEQWRFGVEYLYDESWSFLGGFVRDYSPQPSWSVSPLLPDANRNDFSLGASYARGSLRYTLGYMLVDFEERSTVVDGVGTNLEGFDGTYDSVAHIFTVGVEKAF